MNFDGHEVPCESPALSGERCTLHRCRLPPRARRSPPLWARPLHLPDTVLQPGESKLYRTFRRHCWQARCLETGRRM